MLNSEPRDLQSLTLWLGKMGVDSNRALHELSTDDFTHLLTVLIAENPLAATAVIDLARSTNASLLVSSANEMMLSAMLNAAACETQLPRSMCFTAHTCSIVAKPPSHEESGGESGGDVDIPIVIPGPKLPPPPPPPPPPAPHPPKPQNPAACTLRDVQVLPLAARRKLIDAALAASTALTIDRRAVAGAIFTIEHGMVPYRNNAAMFGGRPQTCTLAVSLEITGDLRRVSPRIRKDSRDELVKAKLLVGDKWINVPQVAGGHDDAHRAMQIVLELRDPALLRHFSLGMADQWLGNTIMAGHPAHPKLATWPKSWDEIYRRYYTPGDVDYEVMFVTGPAGFLKGPPSMHDVEAVRRYCTRMTGSEGALNDEYTARVLTQAAQYAAAIGA